MWHVSGCGLFFWRPIPCVSNVEWNTFIEQHWKKLNKHILSLLCSHDASVGFKQEVSLLPLYLHALKLCRISRPKLLFAMLSCMYRKLLAADSGTALNLKTCQFQGKLCCYKDLFFSEIWPDDNDTIKSVSRTESIYIIYIYIYIYIYIIFSCMVAHYYVPSWYILIWLLWFSCIFFHSLFISRICWRIDFFSVWRLLIFFMIHVFFL